MTVKRLFTRTDTKCKFTKWLFFFFFSQTAAAFLYLTSAERQQRGIFLASPDDVLSQPRGLSLTITVSLPALFARGSVHKTCLAMKLFLHPHIILPFTSLPNYSAFFFLFFSFALFTSVSSLTCISLSSNTFPDFHRFFFFFFLPLFTKDTNLLCTLFVVKMRAWKTNVIRYSFLLRNNAFDIHKPFMWAMEG